MENLNQILDQNENEQIKIELGVDVYQEIDKATDIVNNYITKLGENDPKVIDIKKEYNDVRLSAIETFKNDRELTRADLDSLISDIQDIVEYKNADEENYRFNTGSYLISNGKEFISNGKDIPKYVINQMKTNTDTFLNGNISLDKLSGSEIGWLLSGVQTLADNGFSEYRSNFINQLANDTDGLIYLKNDWNSISKNLQMEANLISPMLDDVIEATKFAMNLEIQNFLYKNVDGITKENVNTLSLQVSELLSSGRKRGDVIASLNEIVNLEGKGEEAMLLFANIKGLESVQLTFEIEKDEENLENIENGTGVELMSCNMDTSSTDSISNVSEVKEETAEVIKERIKKSKEKLKVVEKEAKTYKAISQDKDVSEAVVQAMNNGKSEKEAMEEGKKIAEEKGNTDILDAMNSYVKEIVSTEKITKENNEVTNIDIEGTDVNFGTINEEGVISIDNGEVKFELSKEETDALIDEDGKIDQQKLTSLTHFAKDLNDIGCNFMWENRDSILGKILPDFDIKNGITSRNKSDMKNMLCNMLGVDSNVGYDDLKSKLVEMHTTNSVPSMFANNKVLNGMDLAEAKNNTTNGAMSGALHAYMYKVGIINSMGINLDADITGKKI